MAAVVKMLFRDRSVDPLFLVVIRAYLATVTLLTVLALLNPARLRIKRRDFWAAAVVGIIGLAVNNFFYFEALHLTNVATALLLQYQAPIVVALYTVLVQRQALQGRVILAMALAILGCALVVRAYALGGFPTESGGGGSRSGRGRGIRILHSGQPGGPADARSVDAPDVRVPFGEPGMGGRDTAMAGYRPRIRSQDLGRLSCRGH